MCTRFVLHGNADNDTREAMKLLERRGFEYRLEIGSGAHDVPVLLTPAGAFRGLPSIRRTFGFGENLSESTKGLHAIKA